MDLPAFVYWKSCFDKSFEVLMEERNLDTTNREPLSTGQQAPLDEMSPLLPNRAGGAAAGQL